MARCKVCDQEFVTVDALGKHCKEEHREWMVKRALLEDQDLDSLSPIALGFIALGGMDLGNEDRLD